ncbi:hypothetical protein [Pelagibius marinus]|uniref:hypothetical protein n=1 Tax=Pelagibius marinus TaxID=2762760 RepID=UPI001872C873|nr:hypothetical protein [Pelagibius marinus]
MSIQNQHRRRRGALYRFRRRDLPGGDLSYLPNGHREKISKGTADPLTMERYRSYQARGIFAAVRQQFA